MYVEVKEGLFWGKSRFISEERKVCIWRKGRYKSNGKKRMYTWEDEMYVFEEKDFMNSGASKLGVTEKVKKFEEDTKIGERFLSKEGS